MNKEKQRIAIAKACGWEFQGDDEFEIKTAKWSTKDRWALGPDEELRFILHIPDYLNDLNAMHEAWREMIWSSEARGCRLYHDIMRDNLRSIVHRDKLKLGFCSISNATAAQRAEAFLKTLGLWDEESHV